MEYQWNPAVLQEVFALPAAVVDRHIRLAGSAQLKVLLWMARAGRGHFDAAACSAAIGLPAADCADALQYWAETGVLCPAAGKPVPAAEPPAAAPPREEPAPVKKAAARPAAVKPQLPEVLARQQESPEFAYLLETASARLGRPVSHGDMETLLYLYDTAGLPIEVILMVIAYAVAGGKGKMRYIEKVALDWADRGIDTIAAAEEYLCRLDRREQAWTHMRDLLGLEQSPTVAQSDAAEKWICEWHMDDGLLRMAYDQCREKTGKFNSGYMGKILEHWHLDGVDTADKAREQATPGKKSRKKDRPTSFDLDAYDEMELRYIPVYKKE